MKSTLITTLRDKSTPIEQFRSAGEKVSSYLAHLALNQMEMDTKTIQTPVGPATGFACHNSVVLVPILRAGLAMLPSFMDLFPHSRVGMIGLVRDEKTASAEFYYEKLPKFTPNDRVILLDPMLATGGSTVKAIELLIARGVSEEQIMGVFIISAPEGIAYVSERYPKVQLIIAQQDDRLNSVKYIDPGLGDFGDRYFGTTG